MNSWKYFFKSVNVFGYNIGDGNVRLKSEISKMYSNEDVFVTYNGRNAIYLFLASLGLEKGDRIAVQAFTCNSVINPLISLGLVPVYVDIDRDTFSMSYDSLLNIKDDFKALILQHTFGIRGDERIVAYCKGKSIPVLEDCAHSLGDTTLGTMGDAMILSFGIEKMISSRVGGALVVNNKEMIGEIEKEYLKYSTVSAWDSFAWMINPFVWRVVRSSGRVGDAMLSLFKSLGLVKSGFNGYENQGKGLSLLRKGMSAVLAEITLDCLSSLGVIAGHRKMISDVYTQNLAQKCSAYIRYPYVAKSVESRDRIIEYLNGLGYPSDNPWFAPVVFPKATDLKSMGYEYGICPVAEDISSRVVNLPTGLSVTPQLAVMIATEINNIEQL